jgi:hypothetical protein
MKRSTFMALLSALGFQGSSSLSPDDEIAPGHKALPGNKALMWGTADAQGAAPYPIEVQAVDRIEAVDGERLRPVYEIGTTSANTEPGAHWMALASIEIPATPRQLRAAPKVASRRS